MQRPCNLTHIAPLLCLGFPGVCVQVITQSQPQTKEGKLLSYGNPALNFQGKMIQEKKGKPRVRDGSHRPRGCTMAQGFQIHPCQCCPGIPGCAHVWKTLSGTAGTLGLSHAGPGAGLGWFLRVPSSSEQSVINAAVNLLHVIKSL